MVTEEIRPLLDLLEERVDPCRAIQNDERYRRAFSFEAGRPPLVCVMNDPARCEYPAPWDRFSLTGYREAFDDPAAMMKNQLLTRVVPGLVTGDDSPLAIRSDHGTVLMHSALGGDWTLGEKDYPWAHALDDTDRIRTLALGGADLDAKAGLLSRALDTLRFYHQALAPYPQLRSVLQISLPDLQGPFDIARQLWGNDIFYAAYDEPDLLKDLLAAITNNLQQALALFRPLATDRLAPAAITQHEYKVPGAFMLRADSETLLSPGLYEQAVRCFDEVLLKGGGTIHFCGKGGHLIDAMLGIPGLRGLDFGDPQLLDIPSIAERCARRSVALTNLRPGRQALMNGEAARAFPTGAVFCYPAESFADACEVVARYREA